MTDENAYEAVHDAQCHTFQCICNAVCLLIVEYTALIIKIGLTAKMFYCSKLRKTVCRYPNPNSNYVKRHISRIHIWNSSNFFDIFSFFIFLCFAVEKVDSALF